PGTERPSAARRAGRAEFCYVACHFSRPVSGDRRIYERSRSRPEALHARPTDFSEARRPRDRRRDCHQSARAARRGGRPPGQDMTVRPDAAAKRGGTLRYAVHNAPAHFDVHQSGTVANIGPQSPMYDTLLRRSPKDGQTIIPDLAQRWEISPDNKKYTFHLRK